MVERLSGDGYTEPSPGSFGGLVEYESPKSPYDVYMEDDGIPIVRGMGLSNVRDFALADWPRKGDARGAYIQLMGTEELWGMYAIELPPGASIQPEHHLFEELFFVVEGSGHTEVWDVAGGGRANFEWGPGSLFAAPLNAWHQLSNTASGRALLVAATTEPATLNHYRSPGFIYNCDWSFAERFDRRDDYFTFHGELGTTSRGRARIDTAFIPDVVNLQLPLDNQRSPGYRRIEPHMAGNSFYLFVGQHETGRYAKAHYHPPSPVLMCIQGEGYTYAWPRDSGTTPWADGNGQVVHRQDYTPGGMVSAAPGGGDWFHQHFGVGEEPLRFLVFGGLVGWGTFEGGAAPGTPTRSVNLDIEEGGCSIGYGDEDPHIRAEFEARLASNGLTSSMEPTLYATRTR
jgi:mannose-6-phosphate isomerase-like protein (cupin superfamily)